MRKVVVTVWILLLMASVLGSTNMDYVRASPNTLASIEIAEWASSGIELENGGYLFVVPDYTPVPDVAYWYIVSPDGKTISEYHTNLPHGSVLLALCNDNGRVIATSMSDTSYDPSGPMGVYEYDANNNSWSLLFEYQDGYYRLDPWAIVPYGNMYIISGNLQEKGNSDKIGFIASFSKNGSLLWIKTFNEGGYHGITAYLFRSNNNIYAYLRGDSSFLGIVKVNPYSGDYSEVVSGIPDYSPFLILDRSGGVHSTVGLYRDGSSTLKVYDFASGEWKDYSLSHQVQRSIYRAAYYNGAYILSYLGEDGNIYLTTLRGTEYRIDSSSSGYTGAFLTDVVHGGYILVAYNAGYGFGKALTLNVPGISNGGSTSTPSSQGGVDLSRGLVAYYSFNHCDARDDSGNGHDGVIYGNPKCVDGVAGNAFEFVKYGDRIRLPYTVLNNLNYVTVNFWIKTTNGVQGILSGANYDWDNEFLIFMGTVPSDPMYNAYMGKINLFIHGKTVLYSPPINDGDWKMVTVVVTPTSSRIYIDGDLVNQSDIGLGDGIKIANGGLWLGNDQDCVGGCWDPDQQLNGTIDEVRIYNRALSEEEIKALYEQGFNQNLVTLSVGESVNVTDYSGNTYKLSLLDVSVSQGRVLVEVTPTNPPGNGETATLDIHQSKKIAGLELSLVTVFVAVDGKTYAKLEVGGHVLKTRSTTILNHNVTIIQKVQSNQSTGVVSNKTARVEFQASTEIYRIKVSVNGVQKRGYLVRHIVNVTNVQGNVQALRTIYNISKDVAYSVDDMILPPNAIIIQREPVIALDIKNPKEGERVNQTIIILADVPNSKFTNGIKITHEVITQKKAGGKSKSTCGPGLILLMAMVPIALIRKQ